MKEFLAKFEDLFSNIIDFVIALVKKEFPEIAKVLGADDAK